MSLKKYYQHLFIVLVYKNTNVLTGFFESIKKIDNYRVILVNSFYDNESENACKRIAEKNDADFISIPNKGYSYGNNRGIEYANEHYDYRFLIVSNSDIIVEDISYLDRVKDNVLVIAPDTRMLNGKKQNPNIAYNSYLYSLFMQWGYRYWNRLIILAHIVSRATRELFLLLTKIFNINRMRIFSPHGSFIILTKGAVDKLKPIFNDNMFLYNEEWFLAYKCKFTNIPVCYIRKLKILHLEGASSVSNKRIINQHYRDSYYVLMDYLDQQHK